jgi:hypothetical protein
VLAGSVLLGPPVKLPAISVGGTGGLSIAGQGGTAALARSGGIVLNPGTVNAGAVGSLGMLNRPFKPGPRDQQYPTAGSVPSPPRITKNWKPRAPNDPKCRDSCVSVAKQIQKLLGCDKKAIKTMKPATGQHLGDFMGYPTKWDFHQVVVKDGRVYDAFTGSAGKTINEYKALWKEGEAIDFSDLGG